MKVLHPVVIYIEYLKKCLSNLVFQEPQSLLGLFIIICTKLEKRITTNNPFSFFFHIHNIMVQHHFLL